MRRKVIAVITASAMAVSMAGCSGKTSSSESKEISDTETSTEENTAENTSMINTTTAEPTTKMPTEHISPRETITASCGSQVDINKTIPYTEGSNTIKIPLADLIQDGDSVSSFTFIIYSADSSNIGEF